MPQPLIDFGFAMDLQLVRWNPDGFFAPLHRKLAIGYFIPSFIEEGIFTSVPQ